MTQLHSETLRNLPFDKHEAAERLIAGNLTVPGRTFAGEVLAEWADQSFCGSRPLVEVEPHDSRPIVDFVSEPTGGTGLALLN
jgi:hypothetical protein